MGGAGNVANREKDSQSYRRLPLGFGWAGAVSVYGCFVLGCRPAIHASMSEARYLTRRVPSLTAGG